VIADHQNVHLVGMHTFEVIGVAQRRIVDGRRFGIEEFVNRRMIRILK
jgi:hypothetical protein